MERFLSGVVYLVFIRAKFAVIPCSCGYQGIHVQAFENEGLRGTKMMQKKAENRENKNFDDKFSKFTGNVQPGQSTRRAVNPHAAASPVFPAPSR